MDSWQLAIFALIVIVLLWEIGALRGRVANLEDAVNHNAMVTKACIEQLQEVIDAMLKERVDR